MSRHKLRKFRVQAAKQVPKGTGAESVGQLTDNLARRKGYFEFFLLFAVMVLVPSAAFKIFAGCCLLISLRTFNSMTRTQAFTLLMVIFLMAYVFSPYWLVPAAAKNSSLVETLGRLPLMILMICILLLLCISWAWVASGPFPVVHPERQKQRYRDLLSPVILALIILAFNYAPLHYNIPVQGDEEWHIWRFQVLRSILEPFFEGPNAAATAIVLFLVMVFLFWPKKIQTPVKILIITVVALSFCLYKGFPNVPKLDYLLVRYPFISTWLQQLGPIWKQNQLNEAMFRLTPTLSTFAIAYFLLWAQKRHQAAVLPAILFAVAFALTPNLYYHTTILYPELPALALLTVALYFIEPILTEDYKAVRSCPGWYALLAAGFIKETTFTFIVGIIALRLLIRTGTLLKQKQLNGKAILYEIAVIFSIATPLATYLFFRMCFGDVRGYKTDFSCLTNHYLLGIAVKSLWSQFGAVLILAIGGLLIGFVKSRFTASIALIFLFVFDFFFHFLDSAHCVGLARYNLFLFAPLAVAAMTFLEWLAPKRQIITISVALLCTMLNLWLSPVAFGGEKDPKWASPVDRSTTEYYFPQEQAVEWLKANRPAWPVLAGGATAKPRLEWYFMKANYRTEVRILLADPKIPSYEALKRTLADAQNIRCPLVLFYRMQPGPTLNEEEKSLLGYKAVHVFKNKFLALVLYQLDTLQNQR
jgi:hypothetical protein